MPPSRLTYVGHATVLIELDGVRLLTDPILRGRVAHLKRFGRIAPEVLHGTDAVLVSHAHWDHLDLPSLERLGRKTPIVVPRGLGGLLRRRRFEHVVEIDAGEDVRVGALTVTATLAEHQGDRGPLGASAEALGFLVSGAKRVYFAGDTELFAGMADLAPVDVALLPVAGWGPRLGPGHLDAHTATEALSLLRPRIAVPIHWGTLARIGSRPGDDAPREFAREAARLAPEVEVRVLRPGETLELA